MRSDTLRDVPIRPWSAKSICFLRKTLETCEETHHQCRKARSFCPTRLLRIDWKKQTLALIRPEASAREKYVALSYRWGRDQKLTLRRFTQLRLRIGVAWRNLPSCFQDAIRIALEFGVDRLWIDSLCILQDNPSDWAEESFKLRQVYESAYFTIIAASVAGSGSSFLSREHEGQIILAHDNNRIGQSYLKARRPCSLGIHTLVGRYNRDPIESRAWPLHERLISRRAMIFSAEEVQWECKTVRACQCSGVCTTFTYVDDLTPGGHGFKLADYIRSEFEGGPYIRSRPCPSLSTITSNADAYNMWHDVVREFARRWFAIEKDTLAALSGLALRLAAFHGSEYVAGLWKDNLVCDLLWRHNTFAVDSTIFVPNDLRHYYKAPTFSWASLYTRSASISFEADEHGLVPGSAEVTIHDVETVPASSDPFGLVKSGYLRLTAPATSAILTRGSRFFEKLEGENFCFRQIEYSFYPDGTMDVFLCEEPGQNPVMSFERRLTRLSKELSPRSARVWLLFLGKTNSGAFSSLHGTDICFLVLGKSRRRPHCYERLGMFCPGKSGKQEAHFAIKEMQPMTLTII